MFSILTIIILLTAVNVYAARYDASGRWNGSSPNLNISRPDCQIDKDMSLLLEVSQWGDSVSISIQGIRGRGRVSGSTYKFNTNTVYEGVNHTIRGSFTLNSTESARGSFTWEFSNNEGTCVVSGNIVLNKSTIGNVVSSSRDD